MFLRETRRTNADGSVVSYLQLAHNQRHPVSGNPVAKVIHNFGRADKVDRAALGAAQGWARPHAADVTSVRTSEDHRHMRA